MFFIRLGKAAAWFLLIMALIPLGFGFFGAFFVEDTVAYAHRYFGASDTGEMIDEGFRWLGISIGFGIAAEIGRAVVAPDEYEEESS